MTAEEALNQIAASPCFAPAGPVIARVKVMIRELKFTALCDECEQVEKCTLECHIRDNDSKRWRAIFMAREALGYEQ